MLRNYIKIAWRNLVRNKGYTLINIAGLAVGITCCILIALYAKNELSFDNFHEKADRIVAVGSESKFFGRMTATPYPLAEALEQEIPEIVKAVRIKGLSSLLLSRDGQSFTEIERGKYTEPDFFDIFSFPLKRGNKGKALSAPNTIVLTEKVSKQFFGDENPLGETLFWQKRDTTINLEVTGVVANPPPNTNISFQVLVSLKTMEIRNRTAWRAYSYQTFALLNSGNAKETLPDRLTALADAHYEKGSSSSFFSIPITSLHLSEVSSNEGFTGNTRYLYIFGSIALFILLIACINYVNLATARALARNKEVGVRKTLGAGRLQVAKQFLMESVLLSFASFAIGLYGALLVLPFFNQLFGTSLSFGGNTFYIIMLGCLALIVGLIAGSYPALYLSGFKPANIFQDRSANTGTSKNRLRKALVVSQFTIAVILVIGSTVIYRQLNYVQTKDLGFNGEQVVTVELPDKAWELREQLVDKISGLAGVHDATVANGIPGGFRIRLGNKPEDLSSQEKTQIEESITVAPAVVDYNFIELLDINLIAGRNFSKKFRSDINRAYILNKKTVEELGWTPEEAVGKSFSLRKKAGEVIGVVGNFHISSLRNQMEPVVLQLHESDSWSASGVLLAKLKPENISLAMDNIEKEIAKYAPNIPFEYEFLDDKFDAMYRTERRLGNIFGIFTLVSIVIACLGLLGLAAYTAERRTKEIGIRKVLGATVTNIVTLLSKDFLKLVLIGFVIAVPIAWYAMNRWLADFAYRIEIGPGIFALAGGAALLIALLTVSWQSIRAATANPVDSLRSE